MRVNLPKGADLELFKLWRWVEACHEDSGSFPQVPVTLFLAGATVAGVLLPEEELFKRHGGEIERLHKEGAEAVQDALAACDKGTLADVRAALAPVLCIEASLILAPGRPLLPSDAQRRILVRVRLSAVQGWIYGDAGSAELAARAQAETADAGSQDEAEEMPKKQH